MGYKSQERKKRLFVMCTKGLMWLFVVCISYKEFLEKSCLH